MEFGPQDDPLDVLQTWHDQAKLAGVVLPEAMTLATVDAAGRPYARTVLWRGREGRTISFFTNYESQKARQLEQNPQVTLLFHYAAQEQQVRLEGVASKLSAEASDAYFAQRPRMSQIGAWASKQSSAMESREEFEQALREWTARFQDQPVPRPPHWGGYGVLVERVELWSGRAGRLHDRGLYTARPEGGWNFQLLYP